MYYIERNTITDAMFLTGSVAEPSASETEWVSGAAITKGDERIRSSLHRVFKAAADITAGSNIVAPESAPTLWADMRPTDRYRVFGPIARADNKLVYQNQPLSMTSGNIEYRLAERYANAVALFGLKGATWRVKVYDKPVASGGVLQDERSGSIKQPARGFWDYGYGQRFQRDRILVTGLPIFPNAEIRISVEGSGSQVRALSQCEVGKLRFLPGDWGGVLAGLRRMPKVFSVSKQEDNGSTSVLIYGNTYDMSGKVVLAGGQEDNALIQLRNLLGRGAAFAPTLAPTFAQSLVFGLLESADVERPGLNLSEASVQIRGLPT